MSIRIECPHEGYENVWVEFRDDRWPFKDRRAILESVSDVNTCETILGYVTSWSMVDVDGKKVKFDPEGGMELLDDVDDGVLIGWFIGAWFEARAERAATPKVSSPA